MGGGSGAMVTQPYQFGGAGEPVVVVGFSVVRAGVVALLRR